MFKNCCGGKGSNAVVEFSPDQDSTLTTVAVQQNGQHQSFKMDGTTFTLTYFNARIGGEMIRLLFHKAGVPFQDVRVEGSEWLEMKPSLKWGKLPILEFDGNTIYSSTAISRYLAKRFGLAGRSEIEAVKCDEFVEICQDLRNVWNAYFFGNESHKEENKANLINLLSTYLPKFSSAVEENERLTGEALLVTKTCTWADLFLANFLEVMEDTVDPNLLEDFPSLKKMKEGIFALEEIKKYVETRPETDH